MKCCVITALLFSALVAQGQSVSTLMGSRVAGMGNASAALSDETALFNNVGAMAEIKGPASFFAYEARPSLPGADRAATGLSWPTKLGVLGVGFFRFGDDLYSEQIARAGFSNKFGIASLGVSINYIQYQAEGTATRSAASINFGGLAQITPQVTVGAYIVNLNQSRISQDERIPTKLVAGIAFKPTEQFLVTTEIEKDIEYHFTWKTGSEYAVHKKIFVRTGFNLNPTAGFFGLGTRTARLKIDYALQFGQSLGGAHQASAVYQLVRTKKE